MKINKLINCICAVMCFGLAASCSSSDIPAEVNEILKNLALNLRGYFWLNQDEKTKESAPKLKRN